jgi:hypothetical protein
VPDLRHFLDTHPEFWQHYGDVADHAREAWIRQLSGSDIALREASSRKAKDLARELSGPRPTVIERLLSERVVLCWLQLNHADSAAAQAHTQSPRAVEFWSRRQLSSHRRYLQSLAALATLRRLLPDQSRGPQPETANRGASGAISRAS